MRDWKGWDAVNCLNQSEDTQSAGAKSGYGPSQICTHLWLGIGCGDHCRAHIPISTIPYTYNERLEGSSWCEMAKSVCTCSIMVWNVGTGSWNFHHLQLKSRGVVMVVEDEFQSQPYLTIQYTNSERLEGLRCCELPESVWRHSICGCEKWVRAKPNLYPLMTRNRLWWPL